MSTDNNMKPTTPDADTLQPTAPADALRFKNGSLKSTGERAVKAREQRKSERERKERLAEKKTQEMRTVSSKKRQSRRIEHKRIGLSQSRVDLERETVGLKKSALDVLANSQETSCKSNNAMFESNNKNNNAMFETNNKNNNAMFETNNKNNREFRQSVENVILGRPNNSTPNRDDSTNEDSKSSESVSSLPSSVHLNDDSSPLHSEDRSSATKARRPSRLDSTASVASGQSGLVTSPRHHHHHAAAVASPHQLTNSNNYYYNNNVAVATTRQHDQYHHHHAAAVASPHQLTNSNNYYYNNNVAVATTRQHDTVASRNELANYSNTTAAFSAAPPPPSDIRTTPAQAAFSHHQLEESSNNSNNYYYHNIVAHAATSPHYRSTTSTPSRHRMANSNNNNANSRKRKNDVDDDSNGIPRQLARPEDNDYPVPPPSGVRAFTAQLRSPQLEPLLPRDSNNSAATFNGASPSVVRTDAAEWQSPPIALSTRKGNPNPDAIPLRTKLRTKAETSSLSLISSMEPPTVDISMLHREQYWPELLRADLSQVDFASHNKFEYDHQHCELRAMERANLKSLKEMQDCMKEGHIMRDAHGDFCISRLLLSGVEHQWPLVFKPNGKVFVPTMLAVSTLPRNRRQQIYQSLETLLDILIKSGHFTGKIETVGGFLAGAIHKIDIQKISSLEIIVPLFQALPNEGEIQLLRDTPCSKHMGDVEAWILEIDEIGLRRAHNNLTLLDGMLRLLSGAQASNTSEAFFQSTGHNLRELTRRLGHYRGR